MHTLGLHMNMLLSSWAPLFVLISVIHLLSGEEATTSSIVDYEDMALTPWWPLRFSKGERVTIDCGVPTNGHPETLAMRWTINDQPIEMQGSENTRRYTTSVTDSPGSTPTYYTVLTMVITDLQITDTGTYTCTVDTPTSDPNNTVNSGVHQKTITLSVLEPEFLCTFESSLCDWAIDNSTDLQFQLHTGRDSELSLRKLGPRFDHTYRAAKDIGHFLDMDSFRDSQDHHGRLLSPVYNSHPQTSRCIQLWYVYDKRQKNKDDKDKFEISYITTNGTELYKENIVDQNTSRSRDWTAKRFTITPQTEKYQVVISATCTENCGFGILALDDIQLFEDECINVPNMEQESGGVRLRGGATESEGRVEILHDGEWGTMCSQRFGLNEAGVVCRMLGYQSDDEVHGKYRNSIQQFGTVPDAMRIWMPPLNCKGSEKNIATCMDINQNWGDVVNCTHREDAGVNCTGERSPSHTPIILNVPNNELPKKTTTSTETQKPASPSTQEATSPSTALPTTQAPTTAPPTPPPTPPPSPPSPATAMKIKPTTSSTVTTSSPIVRVTPATPAPQPPTDPATMTPAPQPAAMSTTTSRSPPKAELMPSIETPNNNIVIKPATAEHGPDVEVTDANEGDDENNNAGVIVGLCIALVALSVVIIIVYYRHRRYSRHSKYITFNNPKYKRDQLPGNDNISLDSPLTYSSGQSILA